MLFRPAPHSGEIHCSMRILTRKLLAVASHKGLGSFPGKVTQAHPLKEKLLHALCYTWSPPLAPKSHPCIPRDHVWQKCKEEFCETLKTLCLGMNPDLKRCYGIAHIC